MELSSYYVRTRQSVDELKGLHMIGGNVSFRSTNSERKSWCDIMVDVPRTYFALKWHRRSLACYTGILQLHTQAQSRNESQNAKEPNPFCRLPAAGISHLIALPPPTDKPHTPIHIFSLFGFE
jgi:hypothetical protein